MTPLKVPPSHENNRRLIVVLFVLMALYITAWGWKAEKDSCVRNSGVRTGFNYLATTQGEFLTAALRRSQATAISTTASPLERDAAHKAVIAYTALLDAQKPVRNLDCSGLFPDRN